MTKQPKSEKSTKESKTDIKKFVVDLIDNVSKQFSTRFLILQNKVEKLIRIVKEFDIEDYKEKTEKSLEEFQALKKSNEELIEKVDALQAGVEKMNSFFEEHLRETDALRSEVSKQVLLNQDEKSEILKKLAESLKDEIIDSVIQKLMKL